jgi:hypothetical protein
MTPEGRIQTEVLLALTERCADLVVVWRSNSGAAMLPGSNGQRRLVRFGAPGQGDISGLFIGNGKRVEIEVKTSTGRQSADQVRFQKIIERAGGVYLLVRSADEAVAGIRAVAR